MRELPDRQTKVRRLAIKTATHRAATHTDKFCLCSSSFNCRVVSQQAGSSLNSKPTKKKMLRPI